MNRLKIFITSLLMLSIASSAMASPAYEYSRRAPANSLATLFSPKTGEKTVVFLRDTETIKKLFALDFKLFTKADELSSNGQLGISLPTIVAVFQTSLASKLTSSATSTMTLVSGTTADGSTLSGYYAFILDEGSSNQEFITATCSNTTCTGLTRGISVVDGKTSVTALKKDHGRGASVKITNYPQLTLLTNIFKGTETVDAVMSYGTSIGTSSFSGAKNLISKEYADGLAIAGSPDSTTSTKGIGKISSAPAVASSPVFLNSEEVYTTSTANGVVRANSSGKIATSFIDQTQNYTWSGTSTFSGATTTFSGNIAGNGSANTLATTTFSVIPTIPTSTPTIAGQVVGLNSSAKLPAIDGSNLTNVTNHTIITATRDRTASTAAVTYAHGLGIAPKKVTIAMVSAGSTSWGAYDVGGNQYCAETSSGSSSFGTARSIQTGSTVCYMGNGTSQIGVVSVDATNVTISWTLSGSPSAGTLELIISSEL